MLSLIMKLFDIFGDAPWLERYIKLGLNPKIIGGLEKIVNRLGGSANVKESLNKIKNDKELELELQKALLMAENEYWKLCLRDRQSARERDMALQKLQGKNRRANLMLMMAVIGIIFSLGSLIFFKAFLTSDVIGIISAVAAIFGSCLKDAYSFEFGSHGGGAKKSLDSMQDLTDHDILARIEEIERLLSKRGGCNHDCENASNSDSLTKISSPKDDAKKKPKRKPKLKPKPKKPAKKTSSTISKKPKKN